MSGLAGSYQAVGKLDQALPLYEETLALMKARLGPVHPDTLNSMTEMASGYRSAKKLVQALQLFEETLALRMAKLGPDHPDTLTSMTTLATGYRDVGKLDKAIPLYEETLALWKARLGPDHPYTLTNMNGLAAAYMSLKRHDKSVPLFEQVLALRQKKLGRDHPATLNSLANLGVNYKDAGRLKEAIPLLEEALQGAKRFPRMSGVVIPLIEAYAKAGEHAKLADLFLKQSAEDRKSLPKDSPQLAGILAQIGLGLLQQKQWAEAEPLLRECLAIREKAQPDVWSTFDTKSLLGGTLLGQKKYTEAEPLLLAGYEGMKRREAAIPETAKPRLPGALDQLIELYSATKKPDEVKKWQAERAKYPEAAPMPGERK
jgi:tetratricopeptide (TPR) repeat protein